MMFIAESFEMGLSIRDIPSHFAFCSLCRPLGLLAAMPIRLACRSLLSEAKHCAGLLGFQGETFVLNYRESIIV